MTFVRISALATLSLALAACGSHSAAPIVYGNDPGHQARVYNSPQQQVYRTPAASHQAAPTPVRTAAVEPVQLQPVSAVYLSDEARPQARKVSASNDSTLISVRHGDTVYGIGRRYNVPPKAIIAANRLRAPYALSVGQTLKLPNVVQHASPVKSQKKIVARNILYQVRAGDTLYSISRNAKVSAKAIAQANGLTHPYRLSLGQQVLIPQAPVDNNLYAGSRNNATKPQKIAQAKQTSQPRNVAELTKNVSYTPTKPVSPESFFDWPVTGKVIASYGTVDLGRRNDGVNIAAPIGTPVRASADGEVVYRGSELDGFGNLLLVKHTDGYVTAYAHNDAMLVKKGARVRKGQVIAKVGQTGAVSSPQLHFEVRKDLKAIDPVALLGSK
ncbi:MAG: lipoprotein [Hyphococcus sp.]|nr:MAG: lipoprotein [Marinicaulis sp.]